MNETLTWILAGNAGIALGVIFFGGLLWTIRKGLASPSPALWFLGSALLRMAIVLTGFYFTSGGHWQRLVSCLTGFLIARVAITWLTRSREKEANHAS